MLVVISGIVAMIASGRIMMRFRASTQSIGRDFSWMVFGEFVAFGMTTLFAALSMFGYLDFIPLVVQSFMRSIMFSVGFFTTNRFYRRHFDGAIKDGEEE